MIHQPDDRNWQLPSALEKFQLPACHLPHDPQYWLIIMYSMSAKDNIVCCLSNMLAGVSNVHPILMITMVPPLWVCPRPHH